MLEYHLQFYLNYVDENINGTTKENCGLKMIMLLFLFFIPTVVIPRKVLLLLVLLL